MQGGADGVEEAGARAEEQDLALACQRGDVDAFARLVRLHQDIALRTAYLLTNDREGAEDVAQTAFLQAFRQIGRYDPARPFRPWLLGIVANEARMYRRGRARRPAERLDEAVPAVGELTVDQAVRADEWARVRAALATLDEPQRTATVLHYFNDLSIDEIAAVQGCRPGTVKSRLFAARQRLRAILAAALGGER